MVTGESVTERSPRTCLWAEPYVFGSVPLWLTGWTSQWCCLLREPAEARVTRADCVNCPRWTARLVSMPSADTSRQSDCHGESVCPPLPVAPTA